MLQTKNRNDPERDEKKEKGRQRTQLEISICWRFLPLFCRGIAAAATFHRQKYITLPLIKEIAFNLFSFNLVFRISVLENTWKYYIGIRDIKKGEARLKFLPLLKFN